MKRMRKMLPLCLAAIFILAVFSGCQSQDNGAQSDSPDIKNLSSVPSVKIEALILADAEPDLPEEYFGAFTQKYPSIEVDIQLITSGGTVGAIQPRIAANNLPDIFHGGASEYFHELANEGWLMDIGDLECFQNMTSSMQAICTASNGVRFNVPPADGLVGMFCNMDLFNQAGLEVPTTWDEFVQVCKDFKEQGIVAFNLGGGHQSSIAHFLGCTGITFNVTKEDPAKLSAFKNYEYDYESAEFLAYLAKIDELIEINPFPEGYLGMDYNTANTYFMNGNSAMYIQGTWFCADAFNNGFECILTTAPWNNTKEEAGFISIPETGMLFSNRTSTDRKIASKLAAEFIMGEGYHIIQNRRACIPPFPSDKYPAGVKLDQPVVSALSDAESRGLKTYTHTSLYLPTVIYAELQPQIQEMLSGQSTAANVAAALNSLQKAEKPQ